MNRQEFALVSLRILGLAAIVLALLPFARQTTAFIVSLQWYGWNVKHLLSDLGGAHDNFGFSIAETIAVLLQFLIGSYLLLGGRWLARVVARMSLSMCVECGYDLTGLGSLERCPECGAERK